MNIIDRFVAVLSYEYDQRGLRQFERAADRARAKLDNVARKAGRIGAAITTAAAGVVQQFASYETEIAKIEGLVGISRDQLAAWKDDINAIATETGQSPKQLAEALFFVTSAGLRGSDAIDALRMSARAAAAGLGDQATIVDLVTSAMNAYGPEVLTAQKATDALTEAVRLGKLEPPALAAAMGRVLPVASAMGVSFQEVAGLMAAMSKTGTTAEEAVTQLNAVMAGLLKPQAQAERAMKAVGLSADGLRKMLAERGLFETLIHIRDAFDGNNQSMAKIFPNIRALRGIFDLMGPQLESNRDLLREMADSTGVLDEAFNAQAETVGFKWRQAWAEFRVAIIETGEVMAPFALMAARMARDVLGWFDRLGDGGKRVAVGVMLMGPVLLGVAFAAKVLSSAIAGVTMALKLATAMQGVFAKAAIGTRIAMYAEALAKKASAAAQWLLNTAVAAFPIIAIVAGVAAAIWAIYHFRDEILAFLRVAWAKITGVFEAIGSFLGDHWAKLLVVLSGPLGWLIAAVWKFRDEIWEAITGVFSAIGRFFAGVGETFYNAGRDLIIAFAKGILERAKAPWEAIKYVLGLVRRLLPFSDAREGPLSKLTESGRRIGTTLAAGIDQGGGHDLASALARIMPDPLTLTTPLPVGPVPVGAPTREGGRGSVTIHLNIDKVEINAEGASAAEVAEEFVGEVRRMVRSVAEEFDSPIDA